MKTLKQFSIVLLSLLALATGGTTLLAQIPHGYTTAAPGGNSRFKAGELSASADVTSDQSAMLPYEITQILQLQKAKVGDETIIAYIKKSGNSYSLNTTQIIYLRKQGLSDAVITAMLNQPRPEVPTYLVQAPIVQPRVTTTTPVTQNRDRKIYNWQKRHAEILEYNQTHQPQVVIIGDSLIHYWGGEPVAPFAWAQDAWDNAFAGVTVENLGFGYDRTENALWRIENGELDGIAPKLIIIYIGTNNRLINTDEEIAAGIEAIYRKVHEKQPEAKILLLGLLPRRDENSLPRPVITERVNFLLQDRFRDMLRRNHTSWLTFCDFSASFRKVDGSVEGTLFQDGVHLNAAGYEILAEKIHEQIAALLSDAQISTMKRDTRWANSLGMKFVPVGGTNLMFSVWDTRVMDYRAFANVNSNVDWRWQNPGFPQGETHPVVNVSWNAATAFCAWLTIKEQAEGMISSNMIYRLPTDAEWSLAVGLNEPGGGIAEEKDEKGNNIYPWGTQWPPPRGAGNYSPKLHVDNYEFTSPVGSFNPNEYGLYDMGGNVWQWCEKLYEGHGGQPVLRGASWASAPRDYLASWRRMVRDPNFFYNQSGFRVVLETKKSEFQPSGIRPAGG